jgi:hypothetical protein
MDAYRRDAEYSAAQNAGRHVMRLLDTDGT